MPQFLLDIFRNERVYIIILGGGFLFLFSDVIFPMVKLWFTEPHFYAHGCVIVIASIFMIWKKKDILAQTSISPATIKGSGLTLLGCLMLYFGELSDTRTVSEFSIIVTLIGVTWLVLGSKFLNILFVPLVFLTFIFPVFPNILGKHITIFQALAAYIASCVLSFSGMSVYYHDHIIHLPHITLNVAESCSGLNQIITLVALGFFLGYTSNKTRLGQIVLILSAIFIGVFANGIRVAFIGWWTYYHRSAALHGPADILLVSFIFLTGSLALIFLSAYLKKSIFHNEIEADERMRIDPVENENGNRLKLSFILAISIFLITSLSLYLYKPRPVYLKNNLQHISQKIGGWIGKDVIRLGEPFESILTDNAVKRVYKDSYENCINLFIGYFILQNEEKDVFGDYNIFLKDSNNITLTLKNSSEVYVKKIRYGKEDNTMHGYAWYVIDGKLITNRFSAKMATLINIFFKRKNNAAIVIITIPKDEEGVPMAADGQAQQFTLSLAPVIKDFFRNM